MFPFSAIFGGYISGPRGNVCSEVYGKLAQRGILKEGIDDDVDVLDEKEEEEPDEDFVDIESTLRAFKPKTGRLFSPKAELDNNSRERKEVIEVEIDSNPNWEVNGETKDVSPQIPFQALQEEEREDEVFEVEKVLNRRQREGQPEYLIKWKNYPSSDNSWVKASDLDFVPLELESDSESEIVDIGGNEEKKPKKRKLDRMHVRNSTPTNLVSNSIQMFT